MTDVRIFFEYMELKLADIEDESLLSEDDKTTLAENPEAKKWFSGIQVKVIAYDDLKDQVQEIREKIVQLINEIGELSIDDDLKKVVIYNLSSVNLMMENHKLYGIDEIRGTVEKSFGSIMLNKELSELSNKDTTVKKTLKKTLNLLGSINTVLTFSKNVAPMLPEASEIVKNFFL